MSETLSPDPATVPDGSPAPGDAPVRPPPAGHDLLLAWGRANPVPAATLGALVLTLIAVGILLSFARSEPAAAEALALRGKPWQRGRTRRR